MARADDGSISVKLMDAPVDRRDDPRAMKYIVDHLSPGTQIHRKVRVSNKSERTSHFDVYPGAASIEGQEFRFTDGKSPNELTSWVTVDHDQVDLAPDQSAEVAVTIDVPPRAPKGERYAVLWASTSSGAQPTGSITQVSRVGIRIYLDVGPGGDPVSDFAIGTLTTSRTEDGQPKLTAEVRNTGGRALDMGGNLLLTGGPAGTNAGPFDVVKGTTLAPGGSGTVTVMPPRDLANGPWTAQLHLNSGRVERTVTATITFPAAGAAPNEFLSLFSGDNTLRLAAISAVVGLLVIGGLFLLVRRFRRQPTV